MYIFNFCKHVNVTNHFFKLETTTIYIHKFVSKSASVLRFGVNLHGTQLASLHSQLLLVAFSILRMFIFIRKRNLIKFDKN